MELRSSRTPTTRVTPEGHRARDPRADIRVGSILRCECARARSDSTRALDLVPLTLNVRTLFVLRVLSVVKGTPRRDHVRREVRIYFRKTPLKAPLDASPPHDSCARRGLCGEFTILIFRTRLGGNRAPTRGRHRRWDEKHKTDVSFVCFSRRKRMIGSRAFLSKHFVQQRDSLSYYNLYANISTSI